MPSTPDAFMREAIQLAIDNVAGGGGPFGALIVRDGAIIARGVNRVAPNNDPTAHAEIVAIRAACSAIGQFQLTGCEIYCSCEPCPMCLGAIYWARPDRVYYAAGQADAAAVGFDDHFIYEELDKPKSERKISFHQTLATEGLEPFKCWDKKTDKTKY